jgi:hypothetical protein
MLNCESCDYYKLLCPEMGAQKREINMCEFTGIVFSHPAPELDMEYPCRDMSYGEYEKRQSGIHSIHCFENDDWRVMYKKSHLQTDTRRAGGMS